jgi:glycosyltransferase involved in cell wall biosynthesis
MDSPLVSVVLPTYDRPRRLEGAVESVLQQTYSPIELLVIDDHSPTPAGDVLSDASVDDGTLRVIRHEENRGANAARNTGIREATGNYVAFLDDDDRWRPEKISRQVQRFQTTDDDVGVVYTGAEYVYENHRRTEAYTTSGDVTRDILTGAPLGQFSAIAVDAGVIEEAGLPDERFPSWQDREWFLRLSLHCRFASIEEPLTVRFRDADEQITGNFEEKRDVSYPLFLEKHRSLARSYGGRTERLFVASLSRSLGEAALKNGYYGDAREYLFRSLRYYPFSLDGWLTFLSSAGGRFTYVPMSHLVRTLFHGDGRS